MIADDPVSSNPYLRKIKLIRGNITDQKCDAIVTMIPHTLELRGVLNTALDKATDQNIIQFIKQQKMQPKDGDVFAMPAKGLNCKHLIISIVSPWKDDFDRPDRILLNGCRKPLDLSEELGLKTIAFPPLASGKNGFPKKRAARLMIEGISSRLDESFDEIQIVALKNETLDLYKIRLQVSGWRA